jgi:hypothetical protein
MDRDSRPLRAGTVLAAGAHMPRLRSARVLAVLPVLCLAGACSGPPTSPPRSAGAPTLVPGVWTNLSPASVDFHGGGNDVFTQGITIDPSDPNVLYLGVCSFDPAGGGAGLYKSRDAGGSWSKVGTLDEPIHVRVDPHDPAHLYAADGVRGGTMGFWVSHDGGESWTTPPGFAALSDQLFQLDVYDVAADPSDFAHVLVTSHSPWDGFGAGDKAKWNNDDSGVLESKDGGNSWVLHQPERGWSHGNGVWFLGDRDTWLFGSQADGFWRTSDGGNRWTQVVADNNMQHGGGGLYRSPSGTLFAGGVPHLMQSRDNGSTWTMLGPYAGFNFVSGDGKRLYTAPVFGPEFLTATEDDSATWSAYAGGPQLSGGPFEMAFDSVNRILYSANWTAGLWALKVED